jgi:SulP family sulfate permease
MSKTEKTGFFSNIKGDLTGGLTAAIIALPMGLAFGLQSGMGAEAGLYTAIILAIVASIIAGTKTLISDPTGPMTIVAAGIYAAAMDTDGGGMVVVICTFALAGIFQIAFGFIKVAQYVKYISYPVLSGFMGGIGIIIILFQWHSFFGENLKDEMIKNGEGPANGVIDIISHLPDPIMHHHWSSIILGLITILLIYLLPLISRKIPAGLIALIIGTLISFGIAELNLGEEWAFKTIGAIPDTLPDFQIGVLMEFDITKLTIIVVGALTLAGLGTIDTLLTSVVADNVTKTKHNGNRELMGQGLGNFLAALFGGIPGAGSTTGTVANINSNGKTNLSGIVKGLILLLVLLGLGKYLEAVPIPVLSALLITVGIGIIDFTGIKRLIKIRNSDTLVLALVILLTVFADLLVAVGVGMVLSSFFFMQKMGDIVEEQSKTGSLSEIGKKLKIPDSIKNRVYNYELDGPLFYGFSDQFKAQAEAIKDKDAVIINLSSVPYIDASGIYVLEEVISNFKDKEIEVVLVGVKDHIFKQFENLKVIPGTLPEENAYNSVRAGVKYLKNKLEDEL